MPIIELSDDPKKTYLTPETVPAACKLLRWSLGDLSLKSGVPLHELQMFENYGVMLDVFSIGALKHVLLKKCLFSISEGEIAVGLKSQVTDKLGPGCVVFGGPLKRRPKL